MARSSTGKTPLWVYSTTDKSDNRIHAFLYDGGKMRDLGSLGGKTLKSDQSFALGVNGADEVVGYTYLAAREKVAPQQVAFIFMKGVMLNLNDLIDTAAKSYWLQSAVAINDKGQIAANALDYSTGHVHAVLLTPTGIYTDVDTDSTRPDRGKYRYCPRAAVGSPHPYRAVRDRQTSANSCSRELITKVRITPTKHALVLNLDLRNAHARIIRLFLWQEMPSKSQLAHGHHRSTVQTKS